MAKTGRHTYFMHCLPAHRGLEVTDSVMDSDYSLVFHQAANRLPAEKAVLISVLENHDEATSKEGGARVLGRVGHARSSFHGSRKTMGVKSSPWSANVGQEDELEGIEEKALKTGRFKSFRRRPSARIRHRISLASRQVRGQI